MTTVAKSKRPTIAELEAMLASGKAVEVLPDGTVICGTDPLTALRDAYMEMKAQLEAGRATAELECVNADSDSHAPRSTEQAMRETNKELYFTKVERDHFKEELAKFKLIEANLQESCKRLEGRLNRIAHVAIAINDPALPLDSTNRLIMIYNEAKNE